MKYTIQLLTIFAISIFSCTDTPQEKEPGDTRTANQTVRCFSYTSNKDSITMNIYINNNAVTGELVYDIHEKDRNTGTIRGTINGDTLLAQYTFMSEGTSSVRDVAFLKKRNQWVEGFGEMEESNGRMSFKDIDSLQFNSNIVLTEVPCKE